MSGAGRCFTCTYGVPGWYQVKCRGARIHRVVPHHPRITSPGTRPSSSSSHVLPSDQGKNPRLVFGICSDDNPVNDVRSQACHTKTLYNCTSRSYILYNPVRRGIKPARDKDDGKFIDDLFGAFSDHERVLQAPTHCLVARDRSAA